METTDTSLRIDPYVWRISAVVIVGAIMSILDTTIVNVALETLSRELHSTVAEIQWVVTGYMLALAAVIPITGWAARRFGAKQVYLLSLVLFTAGSALCGAASSTEELILFRVLQGVRGLHPGLTGQILGVLIAQVLDGLIVAPRLKTITHAHAPYRPIVDRINGSELRKIDRAKLRGRFESVKLENGRGIQSVVLHIREIREGLQREAMGRPGDRAFRELGQTVRRQGR